MPKHPIWRRTTLLTVCALVFGLTLAVTAFAGISQTEQTFSPGVQCHPPGTAPAQREPHRGDQERNQT